MRRTWGVVCDYMVLVFFKKKSWYSPLCLCILQHLCVTVDLSPAEIICIYQVRSMLSSCPHNFRPPNRFSWGVLRMLGKLSSTLALRLESRTATPSRTFAQREGNLRRREGGGTAGASRSKWQRPCENMTILCQIELHRFRCQNLACAADWMSANCKYTCRTYHCGR
jgi:hypothetical protein